MAKGKGKPFSLSNKVALQNLAVVGIGMSGFFLWREVLFNAIVVAAEQPGLTTTTIKGRLLAYATGTALFVAGAEFSAIQFIK